MSSKLLNLLSLSKRAGFLIVGMDAVKESVLLKEANLLLVAEDIGENSLKKVKNLSQEHAVKFLLLPLTKEQIEHQLKSFSAVLAVTDKGMGKAIQKQAEQVVNGG